MSRALASTAAGLIGAASILSASGCATTPRAEPAPPPPARPTVAAPSGEPVDSAGFEAMLDDLTRDLASRLPREPEVAASPTQLVLAVGPGETLGFARGTVFDRAMRVVASRLRSDGGVTGSFVVIDSDAADGTAYLASITGGNLADFDDPLGEGRSVSQAGRYDPRAVYFLRGRFERVALADERSYELVLRVEKPLDRRTVMEAVAEHRYRWDGASGRWTPAL